MRGFTPSQKAAMNQWFLQAGAEQIPGSWLQVGSVDADKLSAAVLALISKGAIAFGWGDHAGLYAPAAHTHTSGQVSGLVDAYSKTETNSLLSGKSATTHDHDTVYLQLSGVNLAADLPSGDYFFQGKFKSADGTEGKTEDVDMPPPVGVTRTLHFKNGQYVGYTDA